MKKQRILKVFIIIIVLLLMFVYWLMYWKIGFTAAEQYYENKSGQIVTLSIIQDDYFPSLVDYDKLSRVYKRSISEEELNEANTDAKRLALYRKVQSLTKKPEKHSYLSNASFREGNYYEVLEVDGVRYRANHVLSIEVNYFTFKPYIKKWSIDILELDS
ncbi:hypothetical protein NQ488_01515 [[Bacteroides] pectinophilus]|nr:hypothetical protein NQ488_01515 [[Bacteroides] pectinophilus]